MGCIVSNFFWDFYIFFIFTRPLSRNPGACGSEQPEKKSVKVSINNNIVPLRSDVVLNIVREIASNATFSTHLDGANVNVSMFVFSVGHVYNGKQQYAGEHKYIRLRGMSRKP